MAQSHSTKVPGPDVSTCNRMPTRTTSRTADSAVLQRTPDASDVEPVGADLAATLQLQVSPRATQTATRSSSARWQTPRFFSIAGVRSRLTVPASLVTPKGSLPPANNLITPSLAPVGPGFLLGQVGPEGSHQIRKSALPRARRSDAAFARQNWRGNSERACDDHARGRLPRHPKGVAGAATGLWCGGMQPSARRRASSQTTADQPITVSGERCCAIGPRTRADDDPVDRI
jgi:hypothetical protein